MFRAIVGALLFVEIGIPLIVALLSGCDSSGCLRIGLAIILLIIIFA